jgi:type I restriction enzyme, R subunit
MDHAENILKVMRPYQVYAVEALVNQVKNSNNNAYIWHTTGSGKTLTSFKASQIIVRLPSVHKVVFVVDRQDLDSKTVDDFNAFSPDCIDGSSNTKILVDQFLGVYRNKKGELKDSKLIVTTIQKLNTAISNTNYLSGMEKLKDKKFVFIFDECHRSQFGETHQKIKKFFTNHQMFGFTGTPILANNATGSIGNLQTTASLFGGEPLHKYVIVDAIRDENVLRFAVEYVGKYKLKNSANELDIEVEDIDTKELLDSEQRLEKIVDYILEHHPQKTKAPDFTAMFCVSSVATLIRYYELFKRKQAYASKPLKIATIFSYAANEEDPNANGLNGLLPEEALELPTGARINQSSYDKLNEYIADYNAMFNTNWSTKDSKIFYNFKIDISKRVRKGEIDILLVVNMFLTGFDSPRLNTLYVDKNLKFHGLVQAFSRTNRTLNEKKSQGNIVCFRNLKEATDDAIALFSDKNAKETVLIKPYQDYVQDFNQAVEALLNTAPTVQSVELLPSENEELKFVTQFRELLRIKNILTTFADFSNTDLNLPEQEFEDYKSKYLDLHDKVNKRKHGGEKASILEDVDFELSLIHRDEINVAYILALLQKLGKDNPEQSEKQRKEIIDLLVGEVQLRSKRVLIESFIVNNLPNLNTDEDVANAFSEFWALQQQKALDDLCSHEDLNPGKLKKLLDNYGFTNRLPRDEEIIDALNFKPRILQRKPILERVKDKITTFIDTFIEGLGGII